MKPDLDALRERLAGRGNTIESRLLHLPDPDGDGPVVPDVPSSSTYRAPDAEALGARFQSIIDSDPPHDRRIPEGAAKIYLRLGSALEWRLCEALALAQGGDTAIVFSDGMRAIASAVGFRLFAGAEIVAGVPLYGCTDNLFTSSMPLMGVKVSFVPPDDIREIAARLTRRTRVVYLETLGNPSLRMPDFFAVKKLLAAENVRRLPGERITLVVDNTFATPYCCNPFALGEPLEDTIVVHATTKGINGFSAGLGGVAVIPWKYWKDLFLYRKNHGGCMTPEHAHLLLTKSLRTLALRIRKMQENTGRLAEILDAHPAVSKVHYPGLRSFPQHRLATRTLLDWYGRFAPGHMLSFVMAGKTEAVREKRGRALLDHLAAHSSLFLIAVSLGYIGTLIEDPNRGTHATVSAAERAARGIEAGLIRLSVGIEHEDDLCRDLLAALDRAARR
ncbi:MAG: PLP-dependent transferase [Planctomycetes bacterium]|jgi:cystathionine beta-lyase/cystathionine gamma-synthase|nr:PLP-dependent transferase [Planctomycetota bacterium]